MNQKMSDSQRTPVQSNNKFMPRLGLDKSPKASGKKNEIFIHRF